MLSANFSVKKYLMNSIFHKETFHRISFLKEKMLSINISSTNDVFSKESKRKFFIDRGSLRKIINGHLFVMKTCYRSTFCQQKMLSINCSQRKVKENPLSIGVL